MLVLHMSRHGRAEGEADICNIPLSRSHSRPCEYIWDKGLQSPRLSTLEYQRAFAVWSRSIRASRCTSDGTHHWPMRLRQSRGQSEVVNLLSPIVTLAHRGRP